MREESCAVHDGGLIDGKALTSWSFLTGSVHSCCFRFLLLFVTDRVDVHPHGDPERKHEGALGAAAGQLLPDMAALFAGTVMW